jgi:acyl CoA:acetate/3-ketoacid CoA transferase
VVFVGTFTAGDLQVRIAGGQLHIDSEGTQKKFVRALAASACSTSPSAACSGWPRRAAWN